MKPKMKYISRKMKYFLLFSLIYLICGQAIAQGIFEVVPTDKSMQYLGIVLGGSVGPITLGGTANPMLAKMFEVFNWIVIGFGVVVLSYIGIAAAINTAREGEAMGKKFSLWVPLRSTLGMLMMIPGPTTGYSVVQIFVMWVTLQGIGAANSVWNVVLNQLSTGVQAVGGITVNIPANLLTNVTGQLLMSAVCMSSINNLNLPITQNTGSIGVSTSLDPIQGIPNAPLPPGVTSTISQVGHLYVGIQGSTAADQQMCGHFQVSTSINSSDTQNGFNASSLQARLQIKLQALQNMLSALSPVATQLAPPNNTAAADATPGYGTLAITAYQTGVAALAGGINLANTPGNSWEARPQGSPIAGQIQSLKQIGWIHAGGYYYFLTQSTASLNLDATNALPSVTYAPRITDATTIANSTNGSMIAPSIWSQNLYNALATNPNRVTFNTALQNANTYWSTQGTPPQPSLPSFAAAPPSGGYTFIDQWIQSVGSSMRNPIINFFMDTLGCNSPGAPTFGNCPACTDPLVSMGCVGTAIMSTAESAILIFIVSAFFITGAAMSCMAANGWGSALGIGLLEIFWILVGFLMAFWVCGAMLGIYIPMVPYIIFTTTAVGWLVAVFESLVGAPIIALAMVQPGGEELGAIKHGMHILLNIFFRPVLMIFGFVVAGNLLRAAISFVNFGFANALQTAVPTTTFFGIIPVLGIYAFLLLALVNQAFGLIYELPNRVLRYLGASPETFDPKEMIGQAKAGYEKGGEMGAAGAAKPGEFAHAKSIGKGGKLHQTYARTHKP